MNWFLSDNLEIFYFLLKKNWRRYDMWRFSGKETPRVCATVQHSSHVKVQGGRSCPAFCFVGDGMNRDQNGGARSGRRWLPSCEVIAVAAVSTQRLRAASSRLDRRRTLACRVVRAWLQNVHGAWQRREARVQRISVSPSGANNVQGCVCVADPDRRTDAIKAWGLRLATYVHELIGRLMLQQRAA